MIPNEPPWIVEIDGVQFAAPEAVLLLLKAVSEERDKLEAENEALKRDFTGVHQISQDVIRLAEEIRKTCPQGKIVKRWVLEARARGFSMRMLCERRKADALLTGEERDCHTAECTARLVAGMDCICGFTGGDVEVADDHLRGKK